MIVVDVWRSTHVAHGGAAATGHLIAAVHLHDRNRALLAASHDRLRHLLFTKIHGNVLMTLQLLAGAAVPKQDSWAMGWRFSK